MMLTKHDLDRLHAVLESLTAEEWDTLDELSNKTLKSYRKKAKDPVNPNRRHFSRALAKSKMTGKIHPDIAPYKKTVVGSTERNAKAAKRTMKGLRYIQAMHRDGHRP